MLCVTAKHCRNCDGPFRTSGAGCLVPVFSCCRITLGRTPFAGQHISYRSSSGKCLNTRSIVRSSRSEISIFSYDSINSCPVSVSVFRMSERRRWVSHSGYNSMRQTSMTQGYKIWSHSMTNVSIPEMNMLKNSSTLAASAPINLSIQLAFVSVNRPRETYLVDALSICISLVFVKINFGSL